MTDITDSLSSPPGLDPIKQRRTLFIAGIAHALHDGYTDMIYVLLPVWQTEFGLGYAALGGPSDTGGRSGSGLATRQWRDLGYRADHRFAGIAAGRR